MFELMGAAAIGCTVVIGGLLLYERKKHNRENEKSKNDFWERESNANNVRRKDITFLPYIDIPLDALPMEASEDSEVSEYQNTIRTLSTKRIINFSGVTNTELKETYGVANLPLLTEYDENYTTLVNTLARWGARLLALGSTTDAVTVLEYGITIGTDVSRNYYMLADQYRKEGNASKIDDLIEAAGKLDCLMKANILEKLEEIKGYLS